MKKFTLFTIFSFFSLILAAQTPVFTPTDIAIGGQIISTEFVEGTEGFTRPGNNWPGAERPDKAINNEGQKYLNFGIENTGLFVSRAGIPLAISSLQIWTANDREERDPTSYELYGTNVDYTGGSIDMSNFTLISSGPLNLPATRNAGGSNPLLDENSETIAITPNQLFQNFLIIFPSVKNSSSANSMQIAEVQLFGTTEVVTEEVPLMNTKNLLLFSLLILAVMGFYIKRLF